MKKIIATGMNAHGAVLHQVNHVWTQMEKNMNMEVSTVPG